MCWTLSRRSLAAAVIGGSFYGVQPAYSGQSAALSVAGPDEGLAQAHTAIAGIESRNGGRLGVVALDTGSGRRISYRADERFAICSTHKFVTTAMILAMVDRGHVQPEQLVRYSHSDLLDYAPVTRKHVDEGGMTIDALCAATIEWSDNTAANLLLTQTGGPQGWTHFARSIGDTISRLDRYEPQLNTAIHGDIRDTTTPDAMAGDVTAVLLGEVLGDRSRERLKGWMLHNETTATLLHAGLPPTWRIGDKSGSGDNGTRNDIGMILPPTAPPIIVAVYYTESSQPPVSRDKVLADTGEIIAHTFA